MISILKKIFGIPSSPSCCCSTAENIEPTPDLELQPEDKLKLKSIDHLVIVGKILEIKPHPDPKITKVQVTLCDFGQGESEQILCGGKNIREKAIVAIAKVGATLPGDFQIGERDIRGEVSRGMICARKELDISLAGEQDKEIWILPDVLEACLGKPLAEFSK